MIIECTTLDHAHTFSDVVPSITCLILGYALCARLHSMGAGSSTMLGANDSMYIITEAA